MCRGTFRFGLIEGTVAVSAIKIKVIGRRTDGVLPPVRFGTDYEFVYDLGCSDYDWLVVYDELPDVDAGTFHDGFEPLACSSEHTILCTWEPVSIKSYSKAYVRQFRYLLSNRPPEAESHPGYRLGRGYFTWFVRDFPMKPGGVLEKPSLISAVCSAKQMTHTKHQARFRLIERLAAEIPELEWYGRGIRDIDRKEKALLPYKYHVAVENHIGVHHWTEKFADAILCECLPFYAGDPALTEIFPPDSFIPIPIDDPVEAARIVRAAIAANEYERRREAILEAKRLILERYNFYAQVISVIQSAGPVATAGAGAISRIYERKALRRRHPLVALEDGFSHLRRFLGLGGFVSTSVARVRPQPEQSIVRQSPLTGPAQVKVSVIIPVYNVAQILYRCLDSIARQTYSDFEVVAVDDGSTDGSGRLLDEYEASFELTRIHQENQGASVARNEALSRARGEYILFVDSDDLIHPRLLEFAVKAVEKGHWDYVIFDYSVQKAGGTTEWPESCEDAHAVPVEGRMFDWFVRTHRTPSPWQMLYRRTTLEGYRFIPGIIYEDVPFVLRYLAEHPRGVHLPRSLYDYVLSESSVTGRSSQHKRIAGYEAGMRELRRTLTADLYRLFAKCECAMWFRDLWRKLGAVSDRGERTAANAEFFSFLRRSLQDDLIHWHDFKLHWRLRFWFGLLVNRSRE